MVKTYHVKNYIKDIFPSGELLRLSEYMIMIEHTTESSNSIDIEFTDLNSINHDKTKYRITITPID